MFKFLLSLLVLTSLCLQAKDGWPSDEPYLQDSTSGFLSKSSVSNEPANLTQSNKMVRISAIGMGVAPRFAHSPAQAYALAKRAAMVDAYSLLAERVGGVRIEGKDTIKNMEVTRSEVRAYVQNSIKNAEIVETKFKDGMCEVELEVVIRYADVVQ